MNIDSITRGVVIDHITAGRGMEIVRLLELDKLTCTVAVIRNARSNKSQKKDIIKIEDEIDLNFDALGFIDPDVTVNVIVDSRIVEKKKIQLPDRVVNVARCKNPRCITTVEKELPHVFHRVAGTELYRCTYCEQEYERR